MTLLYPFSFRDQGFSRSLKTISRRFPRSPELAVAARRHSSKLPKGLVEIRQVPVTDLGSDFRHRQFAPVEKLTSLGHAQFAEVSAERGPGVLLEESREGGFCHAGHFSRLMKADVVSVVHGHPREDVAEDVVGGDIDLGCEILRRQQLPLVARRKNMQKSEEQ